MTKDILLAIKGLQFDGSEDNALIETMTNAEYYKRNNSHFVMYEEAHEGFDETSRNIIKFKEMRKFIYVLTCISLLLISCKQNETVNLSTDARVNTFTFYADTLNPGLTEATYKVEHRDLPDTGRIYCLDSLRFGTCLDSVRP